MPHNIILLTLEGKGRVLKPNSLMAVSTRQHTRPAYFSNLQLQHTSRYVNKCNCKVS